MGRKYIIWAPRFNENRGGVIALHKLCNDLNALGEKAYLWPKNKPVFRSNSPFISLLKIIKYWISEKYNSCPALKNSKFALFQYLSEKLIYKHEISKELDTPVARYSDLNGAIVVYSEKVAGNPLGSKRVARWLLHRPGFHSGQIDYGEDDLFFYYQSAFNDPKYNRDSDNLLRAVWIRNDIYNQRNHSPRSKTCYTLRKSKDRDVLHDLTDWISIDGLSHQEIAKIFNECKYFVSYDLYTMYSVYAAMCGCISIVVPVEGLSKEAWRPEAERRYGIAYGEDDIEFAVSTRNLLLAELDRQEAANLETVKLFIEKTKKRYE
jgi:hypothetical protein